MIVHGPYVWKPVLGTERFAWSPPAGASSALDLRTLDQMSAIGKAEDEEGAGGALFEMPDGPVPKGYLEVPRRLSKEHQAALGVAADTLTAAIWEKFTERTDGLCLRPDSGGRLRIAFADMSLDEPTDLLIRPVIREACKQDVLAQPAEHRPKYAWKLLTSLGVDKTREKMQEVLGLDIAPVKPQTTIADTFNRSTTEWTPNILGTSSDSQFSWTYDTTTAGEWYVSSGANANRVYGLYSGGAIANYAFASANHYAQITQRASSHDLSPTTRHSGTNSCYLLYSAGTTVYIYKRVSGSDSYVATITTTLGYANGDVVKLDSNGNTHTVYKNGSSIGSTSDSSLPSNVKTGLGSMTNANVGDDFEASDGASGVTHNVNGSIVARGRLGAGAFRQLGVTGRLRGRSQAAGRGGLQCRASGHARGRCRALGSMTRGLLTAGAVRGLGRPVGAMAATRGVAGKAVARGAAAGRMAGIMPTRGTAGGRISGKADAALADLARLLVSIEAVLIQARLRAEAVAVAGKITAEGVSIESKLN